MEDELVALIDVKQSYIKGSEYCLEGVVVGDLSGEYLVYYIPFNSSFGISSQIHSITQVGETTILSTICIDLELAEFINCFAIKNEVLSIYRLSKERYDNLGEECP